ncbi:MAG: M16 family metallopeptidase [Fidelibacterota bacterium]
MDKQVLSGVRVLSMETGIVDAVTIQGSLLGGDVFSPQSNSAVAEMTAAMLDQGTVYRDKFAISAALEEVGASLAFSSGNTHVRFVAKCLSKDIPLVVELLAEQLRSPLMSEEDLVPARKRRVGEVRKSKEDTRTRAMEAFLQEIYPENHPNYFIPIARQISDTGEVGAETLKRFHAENYGTGNLIIVAVGAVDRTVLEETVAERFDGWQKSPLSIDSASGLRANKREREYNHVVTMEDKTSVDLLIGEPIGIDRNHPDFHPLMVGQYILGGNFAARMMASVRDEEGLTYGIRSAIGGVDNGTDGYWYIWGTFAPDLIDRGRKSTLVQLNKWLDEGVTQHELDTKKSTITGTYAVSLATTSGLAGQIAGTVEQGRKLSYIDEYPGIIDTLTLEEVNSAISNYCHGDALVTVAAGAINRDWSPLVKEE